MTKEQAMRLLRVKNQSDLGKVLGMTRQGINLWGDTLIHKQERMVLGQAIIDRFDVDEFIEIIIEL